MMLLMSPRPLAKRPDRAGWEGMEETVRASYQRRRPSNFSRVASAGNDVLLFTKPIHQSLGFHATSARLWNVDATSRLSPLR